MHLVALHMGVQSGQHRGGETMPKPKLTPDMTVVLVDGGMYIPWDEANNRPVDYKGEAGRIWDDEKKKHKINKPDRPDRTHPPDHASNPQED